FFSLRGSAKSAIKHEKHEITKRTHLSQWFDKVNLMEKRGLQYQAKVLSDRTYVKMLLWPTNFLDGNL
ncbi:MAG: hypothetical protein ABFR90_04135, partial [Planctomycetota bacterium]